MSTEQNKTLVRRFGDLINAQNLDGAFALFTSDFVDHGLPPGTPPGVESSRQFFKGRFAAFPDLQPLSWTHSPKATRWSAGWSSKARTRGR